MCPAGLCTLGIPPGYPGVQVQLLSAISPQPEVQSTALIGANRQKTVFVMGCCRCGVGLRSGWLRNGLQGTLTGREAGSDTIRSHWIPSSLCDLPMHRTSTRWHTNPGRRPPCHYGCVIRVAALLFVYRLCCLVWHGACVAYGAEPCSSLLVPVCAFGVGAQPGRYGLAVANGGAAAATSSPSSYSISCALGAGRKAGDVLGVVFWRGANNHPVDGVAALAARNPHGVIEHA
jgi:hypothetical protein